MTAKSCTWAGNLFTVEVWAGKPFHCSSMGWEAFFTVGVWAGKPFHCRGLGWKSFLVLRCGLESLFTWAGKPYHCKSMGWRAFLSLVTQAGKPYHCRIGLDSLFQKTINRLDSLFTCEVWAG